MEQTGVGASTRAGQERVAARNTRSEMLWNRAYWDGAMGPLSRLALALLALLHLAGSGSPLTPISLEIARGNPLAWLLVLTLCALVLLLARRLAACGHRCRTALLLSAVPGLLAIAVTDPEGEAHLLAFLLVASGALLWFTVQGAEGGDSDIVYGAVLCLLALPVLFVAAPGLAQKAFIAYAVLSAGVLYHGHLAPRGARGAGAGRRR